MKKYLAVFLLLLITGVSGAQSVVCNSAGNLVIISNYDGGFLNISADANIPNLVIGIVSYEAVEVNFSGPYLNNIAAVHYAGFNSSNNHCGTTVTTTTVAGLPGTVPVSINFAPPSPLNDPNGNQNIICAYDCDSTNAQGGCNTVKQVEAYFLAQFPGSSVYAHKVQYGCWTTPLSIAAGGNCCATPLPPLTLATTVNNMSCTGICDGSILVTPQGTTAPYQYLWSNGEITPGIDSLCAGTYTINVTDINGLLVSQQYVIVNPLPVSLAFSVVSDGGGCSGQVFAIPVGGTAPFTYLWDSCGNASGSTAASLNNVCAGTCCLIVTDANGCADTSCVTVPSSVGIADVEAYSALPFPNPSGDGIFVLPVNHGNYDLTRIFITDQLGQKIPFNVRYHEKHLQFQIFSGSGLYFLNTGDGNYVKVLISKP